TRSSKSRRIQCGNNLKQVGVAFRVFAGDHNDTFPMHIATNANGSIKYVPSSEIYRYFQILSNEMNTPRVLVCPTDTRQSAKSFAVLRNTNLSYFLGLDADETQP